MQEFGFECRLCAHLEATDDAIVARQLGAGVRRPGRRVVDIVQVEPGPAFDDRAALTAETIPREALAADVGTGRYRYWKDAFRGLELPFERCRTAMERAVEIGFFEARRRRGRTHVRQTARYPTDWFDRILAVENKPDLGRPGALGRQLRTDVCLGLCDAVVLATASHVTGAHLNRLPAAVGVWRFDPETDELTVVREPQPLAVREAGIEIVDERIGRTEIRVVSGAEKATRRRILAERAYGKGWRTYEFPACGHMTPSTEAALPSCAFYDRVVDPTADCGEACPGYEPADSPTVDTRAVRDRRSPWVRDPPGRVHDQSRLDRY